MNVKGLTEERNKLKGELSALINSARAEKRDLTTKEASEFNRKEARIRSIDADLEKYSREKEENIMKDSKQLEERNLSEREKSDYTGFATFLRREAGQSVRDSEVNLDYGSNGAIIPETIANKIIKKVEDISPLYQLAVKYTEPGTVIVPLEDDSTSNIVVEFIEDFEELISTSHKYAKITLNGSLYGALTKIGETLLNNSNFNLVNEVIDKLARTIAYFIDDKILNGKLTGTGDVKVAGIPYSYDSTNMKVTLATSGTVTADELIDLQEKIPDEFDGFFVMHRDTRKAIRKLKDGQGNYLLEKDSTARWGHRLLNAEVYTSKACKKLTDSNAIVIYCVDPSGLAIKETESREVKVLRERFATQHAVGVVTYGEIDIKVENLQKVACMINPAPAQTPAQESNSGSSAAAEPTYTYTEVSEPTGNPSTSGYYEKNGDVYTLSEDTTVNSEKTYYTRSAG